MAGYTDRAMRLSSKLHGAEYSVTEMVSAKAVVYGDKKTFNLARIRADEGNVALQIFGSEPDVMAEGARILIERAEELGGVKPVAIDINMGCPVNKIYSNGEGSALMKNPELIYKIVGSVSSSVDIPVTVKIRAGVDNEHVNAVECALAAEGAGAKLVAVHGRTKTQLYGGVADREIIKNVKKNVQIPVIANGDIVNSESAISMLHDTKADGIMIGRGAVGNPFIFEEILAALKGERYTPPTLEEKINAALFELKCAVWDKGEAYAIPEARKKIALYFKGFRGSATLRAGINSATSYSEAERIILSLADEENSRYSASL
ncbi:MAG: tRNA dihydrouridine synthase DusB [Ruminococcaceae bacterium]|nr:tRNA dihydrouridine synthase DusB [Oscillospiraceae bacterium]